MSYYTQIIGLIENHHGWRGNCLNMIASENVTSAAVRGAVSSDLGHRYAEGLLGGRSYDGIQLFNRFYQGTKFFDQIEAISMKLAEDVFNAEHANVVPISGVIANLAVYYALAKPKDKMMGLGITCGGHISHTGVSAAGVVELEDVAYPFDQKEMNIDVDKAKKHVLKEKPKIMIFGGSLFLFPHPLEEMRSVADEVGAYMVYDGAHVAGLIAGNEFQDPFAEGVDVFTSSTHKTFPGPQGGLILCREKIANRIDNAAFPGLMSNHHLHHVTGLAIALAEMKEFGREYAKQMVKNAKALAEALYTLGFKVLCEHKGFTESHQVIVDVSGIGGGQEIAEDFEEANMIINKNLLPGDTLKQTSNPSGIRIGIPELTRLGMKTGEMKEVAEFMKRVAIDKESPEKVRKDIIEFKKDFNKVCYSFDSDVGAYEMMKFGSH